jgi:hypothetical protein
VTARAPWNLAASWWDRDLRRYEPPPGTGLRPGGKACWCCGSEGREYKPGWLECRAHAEGPVRWYAGSLPLVLSNGMGGLP